MKANIKYIITAAVFVVLAGAIFLTGRQQKSEQENATKTFQVAIFQIVRHPVLDTLPEGFKEVLNAKFPGRVKYESFVPEADPGKIEQMATKIATQNFDMAFVIGTNCAQSLAKKTKTLPIVLGAATDPKSAGLVETWEKPGGNITGTSDLSPIDVQLDRLQELLPKATKIGVIYNPSEDNSKIILERFKLETEKRGQEGVTATVSSQKEIKQTVVSLKGRVDALYAPTDATVQKAFEVLIKTANEIKMPVFNCDKGTAEKGALFSVGFDYRDLGVISGKMAVQILEGSAMPADMPIRMADINSLFYNKQQIETFGLDVPQAWNEKGILVGQ